MCFLPVSFNVEYRTRPFCYLTRVAQTLTLLMLRYILVCKVMQNVYSQQYSHSLELAAPTDKATDEAVTKTDGDQEAGGSRYSVIMELGLKTIPFMVFEP